jgi:uroporphyrinogen decarboxylase
MTGALETGLRRGGEAKLLLRVLGGEPVTPPPIWLMRQAGRYLAEYRAVRAQAGSFLALCLRPELAAEATLQPIRRFGFDAAILFSDILMVPYALGQTVGFEDGVGPRLDALATEGDLARLQPAAATARLEPVYRTIELVRRELPVDTALIGFAGAPWTVASYMIEGGPSENYAKARHWMREAPASFQRLVDLLVEATASHLCRQVAAGAEVLQLFDSWAGALAEPECRRWCLRPAAEIVARVKRRFPQARVILFPRGVGALYPEFARIAGVDAISLDSETDPARARAELGGRVALQGNLDPRLLVEGGPPLRAGAARILEAMAGVPFVFNLGHGILPETPVEHVRELVALVRSWPK